jgi:hypothetical protein
MLINRDKNVCDVFFIPHCRLLLLLKQNFVLKNNYQSTGQVALAR